MTNLNSMSKRDGDVGIAKQSQGFCEKAKRTDEQCISRQSLGIIPRQSRYISSTNDDVIGDGATNEMQTCEC